MNKKPKLAELLVLASKGRWDALLQLLQTSGSSRIIPTVADVFEERGDQRALADLAAAVRYYHIAFWCRWVLVERATSLNQRAARGAGMMRMKEKLDAAMARERECGEAGPAGLARRIVELACSGSWDEAEVTYACLCAQSDPYGDVAALAGAEFEEAACQAGESQGGLQLWLYLKSAERFMHFAATMAPNLPEAKARRNELERVKASVAACNPRK